jgi:DegV family protein with EDD domain
MHIAIVTDSTADIPHHLAEQHRIHIVPNILVINGQSVEDGKGFSRQEFYRQLPGMKNLPTTATASSGTYQALYEMLFQEGSDRILSIHASSRLSGIYNAASAAAQAFEGRVQVVDSRQVTLGLGFQVLGAAEAAAEGLALEAILARLEQLRERVRVVAMLDTLEYVRRSGRVSWARAGLGNLLSIKPFIEIKDGLVQSRGEVRTRSKGIARLLEQLRNLGPLERLAILHTNAEEDARRLLESADPRLASSPLVVNVTTVVGTHAGPKALGFAAVIQ